MRVSRARMIGLLTFLLFVAGLGIVLRASPSSLLSRISIEQEQANAVLTPCSRFTEGFSRLPFASGDFDQWADLYHGNVAKVIEEHLQSFHSSAVCDGASGAAAAPAGTELKKLAEKLPTWKGKLVSQTEVGSVLLEFLRAYECALEERLLFRYLDAKKAAEKKNRNADLDDVTVEVAAEERILRHEIAIARPTLHRTIALIGGLNRLLPLHGELQCIERTSLDIRNALALGAEVSACLPRIWNAKDPLRDLP